MFYITIVQYFFKEQFQLSPEEERQINAALNTAAKFDSDYYRRQRPRPGETAWQCMVRCIGGEEIWPTNVRENFFRKPITPKTQLQIITFCYLNGISYDLLRAVLYETFGSSFNEACRKAVRTATYTSRTLYSVTVDERRHTPIMFRNVWCVI